MNPEPQTNGHAAEALPPIPADINAAPKPPETCDLDPDTLGFLAELDRQTALLSAQIEGQRQGALAMFVRRRGLSGTWGLTDDRRGLMRRE